jgi:hypothetical protein
MQISYPARTGGMAFCAYALAVLYFASESTKKIANTYANAHSYGMAVIRRHFLAICAVCASRKGREEKQGGDSAALRLTDASGSQTTTNALLLIE